MPMSSGDPGVLVEPAVPRRSDFSAANFVKPAPSAAIQSVKVLTLGPDAYGSLDEVQNIFYCAARSQRGQRERVMFMVKKISRPEQRPSRLQRLYSRMARTS